MVICFVTELSHPLVSVTVSVTSRVIVVSTIVVSYKCIGFVEVSAGLPSPKSQE